jgi:hypothetical protein
MAALERHLDDPRQGGTAKRDRRVVPLHVRDADPSAGTSCRR